MKNALGNTRAAFEITPSATPFARRPNGVYVGATGNVVCKFIAGGADVTFTAVPAGTLLPISPYLISAAPAGTIGL